MLYLLSKIEKKKRKVIKGDCILKEKCIKMQLTMLFQGREEKLSNDKETAYMDNSHYDANADSCNPS